ncbi:hypothetical protein L083_7309 [Actinoplanes sp. N902-109]|nr:hypothetical protein L083_7309 [Actinoplanes sp. N902-109]
MVAARALHSRISHHPMASPIESASRPPAMIAPRLRVGCQPVIKG